MVKAVLRPVGGNTLASAHVSLQRKWSRDNFYGWQLSQVQQRLVPGELHSGTWVTTCRFYTDRLLQADSEETTQIMPSLQRIPTQGNISRAQLSQQQASWSKILQPPWDGRLQVLHTSHVYRFLLWHLLLALHSSSQYLVVGQVGLIEYLESDLNPDKQVVPAQLPIPFIETMNCVHNGTDQVQLYPQMRYSLSLARAFPEGAEGGIYRAPELPQSIDSIASGTVSTCIKRHSAYKDSSFTPQPERVSCFQCYTLEWKWSISSARMFSLG